MRPVIDIISHRREMNPELAAWLDGLKARGYAVRTLRSHYDVCTARRQSLAHFTAVDVPAGATHLIMLDDDMAPVATTELILSAGGDLAYCGYAGRGGRSGHYGDDDFGCACCRISAELAGRIDVATSFEFRFDATRCQVEQCECRVFADQARALGYESKMVGVIGHCVEIVIVPTETGIKQRWPTSA